MEFAFKNVPNETCHENSTCIFLCYTYPVVLSGFILTLIGLVLGLLITFIRTLHTTSTVNSIFIVITMIVINVGVALLMSFAKWYEQIISVTVATVLVIIAILLGVKLRGSGKKWTILLFAIGGVFVLTGFILIILWVILKNSGLLYAILVCWCCAIFIMNIFTTYYLNSYCKPKHFSLLYCVFLLMYEHIILVISLQFSLNTVIDCKCSNGKLNDTMIGHDYRILFQ